MNISNEEYCKIKTAIKNWIILINDEEELPETIVAINFGLYEPYSIELIGSSESDSQDDDWACQEDFIPKLRECPNFEINNDLDWEYVLEIITHILGELVIELKYLNILNVKHITTGFCDGDLVAIK